MCRDVWSQTLVHRRSTGPCLNGGEQGTPNATVVHLAYVLNEVQLGLAREKGGLCNLYTCTCRVRAALYFAGS